MVRHPALRDIRRFESSRPSENPRLFVCILVLEMKIFSGAQVVSSKSAMSEIDLENLRLPLKDALLNERQHKHKRR